MIQGNDGTQRRYSNNRMVANAGFVVVTDHRPKMNY